MKVLGVGLGAFDWHDVEVVRLPSGQPRLQVTGRGRGPGRRGRHHHLAPVAVALRPGRPGRRRRRVARLRPSDPTPTPLRTGTGFRRWGDGFAYQFGAHCELVRVSVVGATDSPTSSRGRGQRRGVAAAVRRVVQWVRARTWLAPSTTSRWASGSRSAHQRPKAGGATSSAVPHQMRVGAVHRGQVDVGGCGLGGHVLVQAVPTEGHRLDRRRDQALEPARHPVQVGLPRRVGLLPHLGGHRPGRGRVGQEVGRHLGGHLVRCHLGGHLGEQQAARPGRLGHRRVGVGRDRDEGRGQGQGAHPVGVAGRQGDGVGRAGRGGHHADPVDLEPVGQRRQVVGHRGQRPARVRGAAAAARPVDGQEAHAGRRRPARRRGGAPAGSRACRGGTGPVCPARSPTSSTASTRPSPRSTRVGRTSAIAGG